MNYFFEDFTESNYRNLIRLAKSKYSFMSFDNSIKHDRFVIWRHDIDMSPHRALALAKIEASEGVQADYFILLSSQFYNVFEDEILKILNEIRAMGHRLGLHVDTVANSIENESELVEQLNFEKSLFKKLFKYDVTAFSFHNPSQELLNSMTNWSYAGLINTYAKDFREKISYCSDSNGYWRFRRLQDVLEEAPPKLQVLTHPEHWQVEPMSPRERVERCIRGRADKQSNLYDEALKLHGRLNIK